MDEEQSQIHEVQTETSTFKKQFCTVTSFSKYLTLALLIAMPFLGFWVGMNYGASDSGVLVVEEQSNQVHEIEENTAASKNDERITSSDCDVQRYQNDKFAYSISYPCNWIFNDENSNLDFSQRGEGRSLMGGDSFWENYDWSPEEPSVAPDDHHDLGLTIYKPQDREYTSIDDYFLEPYEKFAPQDIQSSEDFVTISGVRGRTYLIQNSDHPVGVRTVWTVFNNGEDFYVFQSAEQSQEEHYEILSSFNFESESDPTATDNGKDQKSSILSYQMYHDEQLGFAFKYPNEAIVVQGVDMTQTSFRQPEVIVMLPILNAVKDDITPVLEIYPSVSLSWLESQLAVLQSPMRFTYDYFREEINFAIPSSVSFCGDLTTGNGLRGMCIVQKEFERLTYYVFRTNDEEYFVVIARSELQYADGFQPEYATEYRRVMDIILQTLHIYALGMMNEWSQFENEYYGFSYPAHWKLHSGESGVRLTPVDVDLDNLPSHDGIPWITLGFEELGGETYQNYYDYIDYKTECSEYILGGRKGHRCNPSVSFAGETLYFVDEVESGDAFSIVDMPLHPASTILIESLFFK